MTIEQEVAIKDIEQFLMSMRELDPGITLPVCRMRGVIYDHLIRKGVDVWGELQKIAVRLGFEGVKLEVQRS